MANEASIINNPDLTPGAASSGYQRQNAILTALMNGMDCSVVEGGVGEVTVKISGPIDVNGILYSIASDAVLTPIGGAGNYCIYLDGTGNTLTPTLTMTPGVFDRTKNAHYTAGGKRILNWMIQYDGTTARVYKLGQDQWEDTLTANGNWVAMFSKVYEIWVTGKGGNGGDTALNTGLSEPQGAAVGGGGAAGTAKKRIFIEAGTTWTAVFSAISGGNTTFSDGTITLTSVNGNSSTNTTIGSINFIQRSGGNGGGASGGDINFGGADGGGGNAAFWSESAPYGIIECRYPIGGNGGASIYGGGGKGNVEGDGDNGTAHGSGGGGAASWDHESPWTVNNHTGGTGASGIIRIIG